MEASDVQEHMTCPALDAVYGPGAEAKVGAARLLVVGAGGVGCELVKNLSAVGFGSITLVDLDTIDFSNLNRQFLFRRHHVGNPKATEAASSIMAMIPDVPVEGRLANIKDVQFSVDFFKSFTLVCNALDNLDARRHVNRMCLAARIPLIDSGSTGYVGQCDVIGPGFECYDCIDHPAPKSYAVCTIRSTPEKPVHCVVWAKFLFDLMFGPPDADNVLSDLDGNTATNPDTSGILDTAGTDAAIAATDVASDVATAAIDAVTGSFDAAFSTIDADIAASDADAAAIVAGTATIAAGVGVDADANSNSIGDFSIGNTTKNSATCAAPNGHVATDNANGLTNSKDEERKNVVTDISDPSTKHFPTSQTGTAKRVRFLESDTPESFTKRICDRVFIDDIEEQRQMTSLWKSRPAPIPCDVVSLATKNGLKDTDLSAVDGLAQEPWSIEKSATMFVAVLRRMASDRHKDIGSLTFDKDDRDALFFVTAGSNLRAAAYGVELQSPFAVKGIAGNIVHAVATTNAMVGGLIALEAVRLATNGCDVSQCKRTFITKKVAGSRVCTLLQTDPMRPPNPKCFVCSNGQLMLLVDVDDMTLRMLLTAVLEKRMSMREPIVYVTTGDFHNTLYECGAGLDEDEIEMYEDMAVKRLGELRVQTGSQLVVEDLLQNIKCTLHVKHVPKLLADQPPDQRFTLDGDVPTMKSSETNGARKEEVPDDVEEVTEVDVDGNRPDWGKLEAAQNEATASRKRSPQDDSITLEDGRVLKKPKVAADN